jgi:hypothetical protein
MADPVAEIRSQLEAAALDAELAPRERAAKLRDMRGMLRDLAGVADRYLRGAQKLVEALESDEARDVLWIRGQASLREALQANGVAAEELEEAGMPTHEELDRLEDEGLLDEAANAIALKSRTGGAVGKYDEGKHRRGRAGQWVDMPDSVRAELSPYFKLDHPGTKIVSTKSLKRLHDDAPERIAKARGFMDQAARGEKETRKPLSVRRERDGSLTVLDGKSTHAVAEEKGISHLPVHIVEDVAVDDQARAKIAERISKGAEEAEKSVTPAVRDVVEGLGGEMQGLEHRLKTRESIAGKIERKQRAYPGMDSETAARKIKDALRYTAVVPAVNYTVGVQKTMSQMEAAGFTPYETKNYWAPGDDYDGFHAIYKRGGDYVELQFHTPESLDVKAAKNHPVYEKFRVSTSPAERYMLWDEMVKNTESIPMPEGVMSLPGLQTKPGP